MARRYKRTDEKQPLASALSDAHSELDELRNELTEWRENLESNEMEHLPKYEEVSEAVEYLDGAVDNFDPDEAVGELEAQGVNVQVDVGYIHETPYGKRSPSRALRRDNAQCMLDACASEARSQIEQINEERNDKDEGEEEADESCVDSIDEFMSEIEGVDFPGMY